MDDGHFTYSDHVSLPALGLALDPPRRAPFAFVSHAHSDHIGRHVGGFGSPATLALMACRLGAGRLEPLDFGGTLERDGHRIGLAPAGHVLGAAQIVVEDPQGRRLVYTGDFSVRPRVTVGPATPVRADVLIMECTYGEPRYAFPPDEEIRDGLRAFVERCRAAGRTPVVLGYTLGKAQEAMAMAAALGYPVAVHRRVAALAEVYRRFGVELGAYRVYDDRAEPGEVVVLPAMGRRGRGELPARCRTLYLSGWALDRSTTYRLGVDEALPLSDHADFPELVRFVEQVGPRRVYTTHGPSAFADHLRRRGIEARHLGDHQPTIF